MRFDDRVTGDLGRYAKQAKVIHFEIDPAEIDKNVKTDVAVLGDAKASLEAILPLIHEKKHPEWHQKFKDLYAIEYEKVIKHDLHPTKEGLTMGEVLHQINLESKGEAAIVSDVGQHQMIACRYAKFNQTKSNITSGGLGTMGFGLPAAIGLPYLDGISLYLHYLGKLLCFQEALFLLFLQYIILHCMYCKKKRNAGQPVEAQRRG